MQRKRIVLYQPQSCRTRSGPPYLRYTQDLPLALLAIGAWPLADGYEVVLIDGSRYASAEAHRRVVEACDGAMLYATTGILGWQVADAFFCTRAVKARYPRLPAVIGGWFASGSPELELATGLYDAVAIGQGELTFRDLVAAIDCGAALESVPGLLLPREGSVVPTAARAVVGWDKLQALPWQLLECEDYRAPQRREANRRGVGVGQAPGRPRFEITYCSSFGCPVQCTFCCSPGFSGLRWKAMPAERMVEDLAALQERWGFDGVQFWDANFGVSEARVRAFAEGVLARGLSIKWWALLQVDSLLRWDDATLDLAAQAGLYSCLIGGETGTDTTMAELRKPSRGDDNLEAAARLDRRGIECTVSYMIGLPGESPESMRATFEQARRIALASPHSKPEVWPYRPLPGSADYARSIAAGWTPPASLEQWAQSGDYWDDIAWPGRIPPDVLEERSLFMHYSALARGRVRERIGFWERRAERHLREQSWARARTEARAFTVVHGLGRKLRGLAGSRRV
jgi:hypothetical protein